MGYMFFDKNSIQKASNDHSLSYPGSYGTLVAPPILYFDQTRRFSDGTLTTFTMEIDVTKTINITGLEFRSRDSMVLVIVISNSPVWNDIVNCQLLGGIISTS